MTYLNFSKYFSKYRFIQFIYHNNNLVHKSYKILIDNNNRKFLFLSAISLVNIQHSYN